LPIADCRWKIEKVVWQLLPMSISPSTDGSIGNRKSAIPAILGEAMIAGGAYNAPLAMCAQ
jgi:hypothetical protein